MNKDKRNSCLYESNFPTLQCVLGTAMALVISLPALCISAKPFFSYFLTGAILSILVWSLLFRKSFFYHDHVIIIYPFRLFKRQIRIQYDEINAFIFKDRFLEGNFLSLITKEESSLNKLHVKYLCSSMVGTQDRHKRMSFFFLLKYLKSEGFSIKIIDEPTYNPSILEMRVEVVFGSRNSEYMRKSPSERRKERKKNIIILIIAILIGLLLGVIYPVRSGK